MNQDETNHDINAQACASPAQPTHAFGLGTIAGITLCAGILASLISIGLIHFQILTQPTPAVTAMPPPPKPLPWKILQTQIQELQKVQHHHSQQLAANQPPSQQSLSIPTVPTEAWNLQQARYYLTVAQLNPRWLANTSSISTLLQTADQLLAQCKHSDVSLMRQDIAQDLIAIDKMKPIDRHAISQQIEAIQHQVAQLNPLAMPKPSMQLQRPPLSIQSWQDTLYQNLHQLQGLIRIQHQDDSWLPPSANLTAMLRENIKLTLQQAELGLLEQDQALFTFALKAAHDRIKAGFDSQDIQTQELLQALRELETTVVVDPVPALHDYAQRFADMQTNPQTDSLSSIETPS